MSSAQVDLSQFPVQRAVALLDLVKKSRYDPTDLSQAPMFCADLRRMFHNVYRVLNHESYADLTESLDDLDDVKAIKLFKLWSLLEVTSSDITDLIVKM